MEEKQIKVEVISRLKMWLFSWSRLKITQKKEVAKQVLRETISEFSTTPQRHFELHELTGVPPIPLGIIPLKEMATYVASERRSIFDLSAKRSHPYIKDDELRAIDELLDDSVLNSLLIPRGYKPSMREIFPYQYFRAELLKALKYPEWSYRKFCEEILCNLEQKTARAFVRLPLNRKFNLCHNQLSMFRSGLEDVQMVNVLIYIIYLLVEAGKLGEYIPVAGVDSSELASRCSSRPLATAQVRKQKVRIYSDLDADCGVRRKKRDKSEYFVGYRVHSLIAFDPQTGQPYPLVSLVAPGNHHDNLLLPQLLKLGAAMGLEFQWITADEGYADVSGNESLKREMGLKVVTPAKKNAKSPRDVDTNRRSVFLDGNCDIPMRYVGRTDGGHEYRCAAEPRECGRWLCCEKCREIELDVGNFGQLPFDIGGMEKLLGIRKNLERTYNLLKHREGLEPLRVYSQHGATAAVTFAHAANLLLELVETRKSEKRKVPIQLELEFG